jgi:hypothetical protein
LVVLGLNLALKLYLWPCGLELMIFLPQPPKCWDCRYILPCLAEKSLFAYYYLINFSEM